MSATHAKRQPINWSAGDVRAAVETQIDDLREEVDRLRAEFNAADKLHQLSVENAGRFTRDPRVKHPAYSRAERKIALTNFRIALEALCAREGKPFPPEGTPNA